MYAFRALFLHKYTEKTKILPLIFERTLTFSPKLQLNNELETKPSLVHVFQEAVGLRESTQMDIDTQIQNNELKKKLWDLERELKDFKKSDSKTPDVEKSEKPTSLHKLFIMKNEREGKVEPTQVLKELSPDMEMVVRHLYKEGYFSQANFVRGSDLDFCSFDDSFGRNFIKFAAEKFGHDHQEIAKWLSGSDLKKVASFGCPSIARKNVFSAKRLRKFFHIEESTVCRKCVLKHSCKFANQNIWDDTAKSLPLAVVMRVIISYALEEMHPKLTVPNEIKASVSKLLKEVLRLSQTVSHGN